MFDEADRDSRVLQLFERIMEGVSKFRVSAYDEKDNMICKDSEVGFDETMLVEGLKNLILSRSVDLRNFDKNAFQLRTREGQYLHGSCRVVDMFPDCRTGKDISISLVPLVFSFPRAAQPQQQQQQPSAMRKDMAVKAVKNIKAMAKLNEDNLCRFLLENAAPDTVTDLAEMKKPSAGQNRKGGGSAAAVRSTEWAKFYNAIKTNVQVALDRYANGQEVAEGILVDQALSLEEFAAQVQQGGNNHNDSMSLTTMGRWVLNADQAMKACQRFAIANCITLGIRLKEVRSVWDDFKGSHMAVATGIHTLEGFYNFLGIEYTVDYVRKLIQMGVLGKLFPNLALISCCGIGEIMKYSSDFIRMMQNSPPDAMFWRCAKNGMFGWHRMTGVTAYEGTKKRKYFDHLETAEAVIYEDWAKDCTENMTALLAEDEAASRLAAARDAELEEHIEEVQAEMDGEM